MWSFFVFLFFVCMFFVVVYIQSTFTPENPHLISLIILMVCSIPHLTDGQFNSVFNLWSVQLHI